MFGAKTIASAEGTKICKRENFDFKVHKKLQKPVVKKKKFLWKIVWHPGCSNPHYSFDYMQ